MREPAKRLGRGLASLLGEPASLDPAPGGNLRTIALDDLRANPVQPRTRLDAASLDELARSIAQHGVLQPLLVRPVASEGAGFQIVAGERRWQAARQAGLVSVPCLVQTLTDEAAALAALVENLQREDLDALDEAEGFRAIQERFGLGQEAVAQAVGKSRSHVANTLRLLTLPTDVRAALQTRRITAGHARALLAHADPSAALSAVLNRGLSVRATEALTTDRARGSGNDARPREPRAAGLEDVAVDMDVQALERSLSERLGLQVTIAGRGRRGRLVIGFQTAAQLEGIVALLAPD